MICDIVLGGVDVVLQVVVHFAVQVVVVQVEQVLLDQGVEATPTAATAAACGGNRYGEQGGKQARRDADERSGDSAVDLFFSNLEP